MNWMPCQVEEMHLSMLNIHFSYVSQVASQRQETGDLHQHLGWEKIYNDPFSGKKTNETLEIIKVFQISTVNHKKS